ncbi:MAG: ABC transporter substrate-binding protein [Sphingomonadales bacterium]|nr:ABC transporter substrate-binding protein [Sphingomonadales bacterium]
MRTNLILIPVALAVAACSNASDKLPVTMSVIGSKLSLADPNRGPISGNEALMLGATAQGLVAFDADGQIEPALAERWIMTDDGLSIIFRIRRTHWADGQPVTSAEVAARLRSAIAPSSRNPLKPMLSGVDRIVGMTGQVIEIRLKVPQPHFLQLLAQPQLAIFKTSPTLGSGPYRIYSMRNGVTRLRPVTDPVELQTPDEQERDDVRVRSEKASMGIARFSAQEIALVTGGSFADLALVRAARPASSQFQLDPAYGLFGLAVASDSKALSDVEVRRALAMSINRDRIVQLFGVSKWKPVLSLLPAQLDSAAPPAALAWVQLSLEDRIARARSYVSARPGLPEIRVALPEGATSRLLFAALADDWRRIGVRTRLVGKNESADLRLIDEVAPQSSAMWYLSRVSCSHKMPCSPAGEAALGAVGSATTQDDRAAAIAEADAAFASNQPYLPIALPLRWSLVGPQLTGWRASAFAIHPLRHLRPVQR